MKLRAKGPVCIVATETREKRHGFPVRLGAGPDGKLRGLLFVKSRRAQYI